MIVLLMLVTITNVTSKVANVNNRVNGLFRTKSAHAVDNQWPRRMLWLKTTLPAKIMRLKSWLSNILSRRYESVPKLLKVFEPIIFKGMVLYFSACLFAKLYINALLRKKIIVKASRVYHNDLIDALVEAVRISDFSKHIKTIEIFVENESRNAFTVSVYFSGAKIVVGSKILDLHLPKDLLVSLILHEASHIRDRHKHALVTSLDGGFHFQVFTDLVNWCIDVKRGIPPQYFLSEPIDLILSNHRRQNEHAADLYAATSIGEDNVILMLQAVHGISPWLVHFQYSTGFIIPFKMLSWLYPKNSWDNPEKPFLSDDSHPSLKKRIERLQLYKKERENYPININK